MTDDVNLYWPTVVASGVIMTMPISGGTPSTLLSSGDFGFDSVSLALGDAEGIYYVASTGPVGPLYKLATGQPGPGQVLYEPSSGFVQTGAVGQTALAISGGDICFIAYSPSQSIVCVPKAGGAAQELVPPIAGVNFSALTADDTAVHWISSEGTSNSTVYRIAK